MRRFAATFLCALPLSLLAQTQAVTVVELHQAPGQFVNLMPKADETTTQEELCQKAMQQLDNELLISLGAYGGYITVQFDHAVQNKPGSDFRITGNGFYAAADPVYGEATIGGSFEPGIVYVGVGDDVETAEWYELAGSEYYTTEVHDFQITYYKPTKEKVGSDYLPWHCSWTDCDGTPRDSTGYHAKNQYHTQTYWPLYEGKDSLTFRGGRLPNNAIDQSGQGTYWVLYRYGKDSYGYADASLNTDDYSTFDIDWAVDKDGRHVELKEVNFIRVMCGLLQECGWIGETSTEVGGFTDLHLLDGYDDNPIMISTGIRRTTIPQQGDNTYYNLMGQRVTTPEHGNIYIRDGRKILY